ncbi:MAG: glycosyltransferase family 2 protein, partial [Paracoccaceae bacterium]
GGLLERARTAVADALMAIAPDAYAEWVFVNDGSTDATEAVLAGEAARDPLIRVLTLSRNFGKEAALAAGLDHAAGDAVIPIDVDLQDPPELIPDLVAAWRNGAKVVNAQRDDRSTDSRAKRVTARWFYRLYNRLADQPIPEDVGDFRLMDREVVEVIRTLSEHARFNKGLFSWVGFPVATVTYRRDARSAGQSKWPVARLWNLAIDGLVASSTVPLRVWTWLGGLIACGAFAYALFLIAYTLIFGRDTPGFASIMVVMLFLGGLNMLALGILGEYVGRIAEEVRGRPLYVVSGRTGFSDEEN